MRPLTRGDKWDPRETIVAILGIDEAKRTHFLGTGTFVYLSHFLVTAEHVVRESMGSFTVAVPVPGLENATFPAQVVARHREVDLALLEVAGYSPNRAVQLADDSEIVTNRAVFCFGYSTTRNGGGQMQFAPTTRFGNVTRCLHLGDIFGGAGEDILELSFPALRGASGAPIISNSTLHLWGIVIQNMPYQLLPARIEGALDADDQIYEEPRFMLPRALAVRVRYLRAIL